MRSWAAAEWFVWRVFVVAGCVVIALQLAKLSPEPPPMSLEDAFAQLVTAEELQRYDASLRRTIATPTSCPRPVLRGTPVPGPAAADQRAVAEGASFRCLTAWRDVTSFDTPPAPLTTKQLEVLARCGPIVESAIRAAISHEDACSAYALGGEASSDQGFYSQILVGKLLGEHARQRAAAGDVDGALWLTLELVRFSQDYTRGRTNLLHAMLGVANSKRAIDAAHAILDRGRPANLDELATAMDRLLASEVRSGEALASDILHVALDPGLRSPGDVPSDAERDRSVHLALLAAFTPGKVAAVCPANASLAKCRRNLGRAVAAIDSDGTLRAVLLQALVENETARYLAMLSPYIARRAIGHGDLIALRIRIESLRSGCTEALAKLATTPTLGDSMRLTHSGDTLVIEPPLWVTQGELEPAHEPIRIRCP